MIEHEDLAEILGTHVMGWSGVDCSCGWIPPIPNGLAAPFRAQHREHLAAKLADAARCVSLACAECGTTTAQTYVVTILNQVDPDTRTEVCRACDDELRR